METTACQIEIIHGKPRQRKNIYIEHRAAKAARLAIWRKMTQPGEFFW
jgi:hypothetical protein